jgi:hypothetical protein
MGPVHLYLAAWVAGGVLLGASMLLDGRETAPTEPATGPEHGAPDHPFGARAPEGALRHALREADYPGRAQVRVSPARGSLLRLLRVAPFGLIGFGLCGLTAKGLNLDLWPWTLVCALTVGLSLVALGYGLSRPRAR